MVKISVTKEAIRLNPKKFKNYYTSVECTILVRQKKGLPVNSKSEGVIFLSD
jgi:hypothetical protein